MTGIVLTSTTTRMRWVLVAWTLGIWGSRLRNIVVDDELAGLDRVVSYAVALTLIAAAIAVAAAIRIRRDRVQPALLVLVTIGIVRWTIRGPVILVSNEWDLGFKIVHTVLWLVTVVLSVLAWQEQQRAQAR